MRKTLLFLLISVLFVCACGSRKSGASGGEASRQPAGPAFCADSAYHFCEVQCSFGPRTMNSEAHDSCGSWIAAKFRSYGMQVVEQKATLDGYDGTPLRSTNIIASYKPELTTRILLCAHWDSRPWADNDADSANWRKPVLAANDGASGVAVMLEIARLIAANDSCSPALGIDFVCFDAEDWGVPQWSNHSDNGNSWALGAQHWAANPHKDNYEARFGILLDMVGGSESKFYQEGVSKEYAPAIVDKVWNAAEVAGFASYFPKSAGGFINDDHVPVNQTARIPTIDIIPYFPDCEASSFGPTWHTINDNMDHIDKAVLRAVGQTVIQVLFTEK
ncbi:MAG: M28 family peptidase [Prevotella sp.]